MTAAEVALDDLALVARGWATLSGSQERAVARELLDLRISLLISERGICGAPHCALWEGHAAAGWCHVEHFCDIETDIP